MPELVRVTWAFTLVVMFPRLLCLVFVRLVGWLMLLARMSASQDVEIPGGAP